MQTSTHSCFILTLYKYSWFQLQWTLLNQPSEMVTGIEEYSMTMDACKFYLLCTKCWSPSQDSPCLTRTWQTICDLWRWWPEAGPPHCTSQTGPHSQSPRPAPQSSPRHPGTGPQTTTETQTQLRMVQIFLQHVTGTCHQIKCGFFLKKFCLLQILQKWIKYYCNFFHLQVI